MSGLLWLAAIILAYHLAIIGVGLHFAHRGVLKIGRPPQPRKRPETTP